MTRSSTGYDLTPLSGAERDRLAARLSPEERRILLEHGTERAFCGTLLNNKSAGAYACKLCGLPLFRSDTKFESGTGWPSFNQPFDRGHITYIRDTSYGMVRVEIRCARCDGHLGHVFPDGPPPTHERYCLNSEALDFHAAGVEIPQKGGA
jgi:peptide-methionine (R)-S-oxide reductase